MLQEFAGEGIPVLASVVPAESFYSHLSDLLPLIMNKAVSLALPFPDEESPVVNCVLYKYLLFSQSDLQKSSCTVADRSFSVGTLSETLHSLAGVSGGRAVAGKLSNRLLPVLVSGVKDSDAEVRNNSVFGLGALAQAAGPIVSSYP